MSEPLEREVLLKLDVQGYADRVLRGASEALQVASACILEICIDMLYENQAEFSVFDTLLTNSGFKYAGNIRQFHGEDGHVMWIDALFKKLG